MQRAVERERKVVESVAWLVVRCGVQAAEAEKQKNRELSRVVAQHAATEQRELQMSYR